MGDHTAKTYLTQLADFVLATPGTGLGCPDLGPLRNLPEYPILEDPKYQGRVPIAPSVQAPDFAKTASNSVASTYALGIDLGPNGMAAQIIAWADEHSSGNAFTLEDVAAYVTAHPDPNVAPPTW